MQILISLIAFIAAICVLVVFHEFGHFWVARRLGVKVLKFSVGFGRPIFKWNDKSGTQYVLSWLPFGGYVKMLDEREGEVAIKDKRQAFNNQALYKRVLIVLAGPVFNFLFAIFAYWLMFVIGITNNLPIIGSVLPNSAADLAGLKPNSQIISIEDAKTNSWNDVIKAIIPNYGVASEIPITTKNLNEIILEEDWGNINNEDLKLSKNILNIKSWDLDLQKTNLLEFIGVVPFIPSEEPIVYKVLPNEAAILAGFKAKDIILSVNDAKINNWADFVKIIQQSANQELLVTVLRTINNKPTEVDLVLVPKLKENNQGFAGLTVKPSKYPKELTKTLRFSPIEAFSLAVGRTVDYITFTLQVMSKMIVGEIGLDTLSGPLSIAQGAGVSLIVGFSYYLSFLALISISLGVINLLPIPMLDGGHLLFYAYEAIARRPLSDKAQITATKVGVMIIILLLATAVYNDIIRLFG